MNQLAPFCQNCQNCQNCQFAYSEVKHLIKVVDDLHTHNNFLQYHIFQLSHQAPSIKFVPYYARKTQQREFACQANMLVNSQIDACSQTSKDTYQEPSQELSEEQSKEISKQTSKVQTLNAGCQIELIDNDSMKILDNLKAQLKVQKPLITQLQQSQSQKVKEINKLTTLVSNLEKELSLKSIQIASLEKHLSATKKQNKSFNNSKYECKLNLMECKIAQEQNKTQNLKSEISRLQVLNVQFNEERKTVIRTSQNISKHNEKTMNELLIKNAKLDFSNQEAKHVESKLRSLLEKSFKIGREKEQAIEEHKTMIKQQESLIHELCLAQINFYDDNKSVKSDKSDK